MTEGEVFPQPNDSVQYQGEGSDHIVDLVKYLGRKVPYFIRQDTLTKQTAIVFPAKKVSTPGTISVYTQADGYREFTLAAMDRFGPPKKTIQVASLEDAIRVPGDNPVYQRIREAI